MCTKIKLGKDVVCLVACTKCKFCFSKINSSAKKNIRIHRNDTKNKLFNYLQEIFVSNAVDKRSNLARIFHDSIGGF